MTLPRLSSMTTSVTSVAAALLAAVWATSLDWVDELPQAVTAKATTVMALRDGNNRFLKILILQRPEIR